MKKYIIIVIVILLLMVLYAVIFKNNKLDKYEKNLFYMDTYINITIYNESKEKANAALDKIDSIYKNYHDLTNRYEENELINVYYINNNNDDKEYLDIDSKLYNLLEYGINWYQKSNNLLNINMGNIIDVWKKYRDLGNGIPTSEEINNAAINDINKIILKDGKIKNNHPNIDLGAIAKGYATEEAGKYLESIGIDKYIINAGGNVKVGNHYAADKYKIGIENPEDPSKIYMVIKGNNISVVTSGGYQRFYEYNGKRYSHIIDPNTLYPGNYMKSVTVITKDSSLGDALSTTLFLMSIQDGMEYIKQFDDVAAIWYTNDNEIIKSKGISKYE